MSKKLYVAPCALAASAVLVAVLLLLVPRLAGQGRAATAYVTPQTPSCNIALVASWQVQNPGTGAWECEFNYPPDNSNPFNDPPNGCEFWAYGKRPDIFENSTDHNTADWEATTWVEHARAEGYTVNKTPAQGAIAVWVTGTNTGGHVAYVEQVEPDGSYVVSDFNGNYGLGKGALSLVEPIDVVNNANIWFIQTTRSAPTPTPPPPPPPSPPPWHRPAMLRAFVSRITHTGRRVFFTVRIIRGRGSFAVFAEKGRIKLRLRGSHTRYGTRFTHILAPGRWMIVVRFTADRGYRAPPPVRKPVTIRRGWR